ncbi:hypothetical protein PAPHI01_1118 [Pancytospora philotis]|nr:hypothetical protein PAPHI01_1118 [Pancytospora philotis]
MGNKVFTSELFRLDEASEHLGLASLIPRHRALVTYNQLMKCEQKVRYVFIFDAQAVEVPSLILFCLYFKIALVKLPAAELLSIQQTVKHARMVCVIENTELCSIVEAKMKSVKVSSASVDLLKVGSMRV